MSEVLPAVQKVLDSFSLRLSQDGLNILMPQLSSKFEESIRRMMDHILVCDLGQFALPSLPVINENTKLLNGRFILQVETGMNVAVSRESQKANSEGLALKNSRIMETEADAVEDKPSVVSDERLLKLVLSDGHKTFLAMEFVRLPFLPDHIPTGFKLVVENVPIRHSVMLLTPENCKPLTIDDVLGNKPVVQSNYGNEFDLGSDLLADFIEIKEPIDRKPEPEIYIIE